jgi:hypothetical protein
MQYVLTRLITIEKFSARIVAPWFPESSVSASIADAWNDLAFRELLTVLQPGPHHFRECARLGIRIIAVRLELRQIEQLDAALLELAVIWFRLRIDISQSWNVAPNLLRECEGKVVLRDNTENLGPAIPIRRIWVRKTSTSTSGATSMAFLSFADLWPDRIDLVRNAFSVMQFPIECARILISVTSGWRSRVVRTSSRASREKLALSRS